MQTFPIQMKLCPLHLERLIWICMSLILLSHQIAVLLNLIRWDIHAQVDKKLLQSSFIQIRLASSKLAIVLACTKLCSLLRHNVNTPDDSTSLCMYLYTNKTKISRAPLRVWGDVSLADNTCYWASEIFKSNFNWWGSSVMINCLPSCWV